MLAEGAVVLEAAVVVPAEEKRISFPILGEVPQRKARCLQEDGNGGQQGLERSSQESVAALGRALPRKT